MFHIVLLLHFFIKLNSFACGEIITLVRDNYITCVTNGNSVNFPIYISPPLNNDYGVEEYEFIDWIKDDWFNGTEMQFNFSSVTDRRWENFLTGNLYKGFPIINNAFSFSVCAYNNFNIEIRDPKFVLSKEILLEISRKNKIELSQECEWFHYTMQRKNYTLNIINKNLTIDFEFYPKFFLRPNQPNVVKWHKYNFKYSNHVATNNETYFLIDFVENVFCLSMFVSVDERCYLKVTIKNEAGILINETAVKGFNSKNNFKKWKEIKIEANFTGKAYVFLYRGRNDSQTTGFWAVDDVKFCRSNIHVYKPIIMDKDDYVCRSLEDFDSSTFCETPGFLGRNCSIKCEDILGKSHRYCENYKICMDSKSCQCSWGFEGSTCQEGCNNSYWGLGCKKTCSSNCKFCDPIQGCKKEKYALHWPPTLLLPIQNSNVTIILESKNYKFENHEMEYYQVQCKEVSDTFFKNCSDLKRFTRDDEDIAVTNLMVTNKTYTLRIVLTFQNQFYTDDVPELFIQEDIFDVFCENNVIQVKNWTYRNCSNNFHFEYECHEGSFTQKKNSPSTFISFDYFCLSYVVYLYDIYPSTNIMYLKRKISGTCSSKNITCSSNCDSCDNVTGYCIKCRWEFFGKFCSEKNLVMLAPPYFLLPIINDTLIIGLQETNYKTADVKPKFFQVQYKEFDEVNFKNYSFLRSYTENDEHIEITNLDLNKKNYTVRIVLIANNHFYTNNVPELYTHMDLFDVICQDNKLIVTNWTRPNCTKFWFEYKCFFHSSVETKSVTTTTATFKNFCVNYTVNLYDTYIPTNIAYVKRKISGTCIAKNNSGCNSKVCSESNVPLLIPPGLLLPKQSDKVIVFLEYTKKENFIKPKLFQVQYKEHNEASFKNHSDPKPYFENKKIEVSGLNANEKNYIIRIVLIDNNNQFYIDEIPELLTQEDIFDVICEDKMISVKNWTYSNCTNGFLFEYECFQSSGSLKNISEKTHMIFNEICVNYTVKLTDLYTPTNTTYVKREMSGVCYTNDDSWIIKIGYIFLLLIVVVLIIVFAYFLFKKRTIENRDNMSCSDEAIAMFPLTSHNESTIMDLMSFKSYILNLIDSTLKSQFDSFSEGQGLGTTVIALKPQNIDKNRDRNRIVPYDQNRIILSPMKGVGRQDYINASYIDGYDRKKAYIACQGPKYHTVKDFWRMIWQNSVETIIMVNNLIENKERICAEYWPQRINGVFECGKILIKLISETNYEFYVCRKFQIYYDSGIREVLQFHLKWTLNNSEIFYSNNALPVVKRVREIYKKSSSPIVVHSRYGTNRTALVILCDIALQMIETEKKIDIYSLTKQLTEQRPFFINNVIYYLLAHLIVNEYLLEENSPFKTNVNRINEKLEYVQLLNHNDMMIQKYIPLIVKNYSHTSWITRYGNIKKYLITKVPTEEEFVEFWKMVATEFVSSMIFLNQKLSMKTNRSVSSSEIIEVRYLEVKQVVHCKQTRILLLIYAKPSNQIIYERQIKIFEFKDWNHRKQLPKSRGTFIRMLNEIHRIEPEEDHVLVGCSDGFTASGLFVVMSYILEKYEKELDVDVCNAIRIARRSGKKFINKTQLIFIYSCINEYIQNYDKYQVIPEL